MDPRTRRQLLEISRTFYAAHAAHFDASRGHHAWPGWQRWIEWLPTAASAHAEGAGHRPLRVLDVGCGNARLATFLAGETEDTGGLEYLGVDANAALLDSARARLAPELAACCELSRLDFLAGTTPGHELPQGPFDLAAVMGVLHHVPGADWRLALLRAAAARLDRDGMLALATWQFDDRERFAPRHVDWAELGPVLGEPVDPAMLEPGDRLLRFGDDPTAPPRYCHQVCEAEFESWPEGVCLEPLEQYFADGAEG
ncbi:MAG: hypothetical protein CL908_22275, partial [Deltaproteobacteria bacterium]|nr:hypothetical protein [Deltaproteobacteria bacterium]